MHKLTSCKIRLQATMKRQLTRQGILVSCRGLCTIRGPVCAFAVMGCTCLQLVSP